MKTSNGRTKNGSSNGARTLAGIRKFTTQARRDSCVWGNICDTLRRSNRVGALQYISELTWILFLRILDDCEGQEAEQAEAVTVTIRYGRGVAPAVLCGADVAAVRAGWGN